MNKLKTLIFGTILLALGFVILWPNLDFLIKENFGGWARTVGQVDGFNKKIEGDRVFFEPVFNFEVGGVLQEKLLAKTEVSPEIGRQASVLFDPQNPTQAIIGGLEIWRFVGILPIIVGVLAIFSFNKKPQIHLETEEENLRHINKLKRTGVEIKGQIIDIEVIDIHHAKAIIRAKTVGGLTKNHRSAPIEGLTDGALVGYLSDPRPISIYVNPENPEDYFVNSEDVLAAIELDSEKEKYV